MKTSHVAWGLSGCLLGCSCYLVGSFYASILVALSAALALWLYPDPPTTSLDDKKLPGKRMWLNDKFSAEKVPENVDVVVVGSGMGGLTTAAILARFGKRVVVLEQHDIAGGATHEFDLKGYKFDSGLHYTVPWHGKLFQLTTLRNDVPEVDMLGSHDGVFDKVFLGDDNTAFDIKYQEEHFDRLKEMFPEESDAIDRYARLVDDQILAVRLFCFVKLFPFWLQKFVWSVLPAKYCPSKETARDVLEKMIKNKKLQSLMCSLWLDTGGRPDEATLMLTGAVQRGLPREGGCYPRGGPRTMARFLISTILQHGGRVFVEANVKEIVFDHNNAVSGVKVADGTVIKAKQVVSSAGYRNTFQHMVAEKVTKAAGVPRDLPVAQSPGFMMCNVGIEGNPDELDIHDQNLWYLPVDKEGSIFGPIEKYFDEPLDHDMACFITWPSLKDKSYKNDGKIACQLLAMADISWYNEKKDGPFGSRVECYEKNKKQWEEKFLEKLYRFFPKVKGKVKMVDMSTPLSAQHYLGSVGGCAVGLSPNVLRFSPEMQKHLDSATAVEGLWMTGQDTLICGVTLAQLSGVVTACRMVGVANSVKMLLQSIFFL